MVDHARRERTDRCAGQASRTAHISLIVEGPYIEMTGNVNIHARIELHDSAGDLVGCLAAAGYVADRLVELRRRNATTELAIRAKNEVARHEADTDAACVGPSAVIGRAGGEAAVEPQFEAAEAGKHIERAGAEAARPWFQRWPTRIVVACETKGVGTCGSVDGDLGGSGVGEGKQTEDDNCDGQKTNNRQTGAPIPWKTEPQQALNVRVAARSPRHYATQQ